MTNESLFLELFLRGLCPLNAILSERLANYLVKHHQLNDFTLTLFSSHVTCLKRFVLNVKYVSRLQCHMLNQHPHLSDLELIFKDSNLNRTTDLFYQYICPSIDSKFDEIYTIYGAFALQEIQRRVRAEVKGFSPSDGYPMQQRSSNLFEGFSQQQLLHIILNNLHPLTFERLKILKVAHYKFFAAHHTTNIRKSSLVDMSPLTKW